ncbi:MAG: hypothetical protein IPM79_39655 [Polyangiaceae bacterium]|jgi:tetratricopeptide (TPR) repeat protein|nr:hypothetical protein [Polyangiaceae bacterium]MBK8943556.1 hypothetical protein [Polyangiaceae bacterium]
MTRLRFAVLVVVASALGAPASVALAQPKAPAAASAKDEARELFKKGTAALDAKQYTEAAELLRQAEERFHAPTHLLYLARAQSGMKQLLAAKATYEKLRDEQLPPKTSDAFVDAQKQAVKELEELTQRLPKVVVRVEPSAADAVVTMNGETLAAEKLGPELPIDPGKYTFEAKASGLESGRVTVEAAERTTTEVKLVLVPIGGQQKSGTSTVKTNDAAAPWTPMKIASVPMMGLGGAALAAGGALGALHFVRASEADDKYAECFASCQAEVESLDAESATFGSAAIGLLAGGAALLTTGIILFAVAPSGASDDAPATAVQLELFPGGLGVSGQF